MLFFNIKNNSEEQQMKSTVIGISGASASGKSTFSEQLRDILTAGGAKVEYISADRFYKKTLPTVISPLDGKEYPDWNHPTSIDGDAAAAEILRLISENPDFIIIDGAFIFCIEAILKLCDYKIFVTASIETRIYRRIKRNVILKKQSIEQIGEYYLAAVRYREREYSLPSERFADVVIDNENGFNGAVEREADKLLKTRNL